MVTINQVQSEFVINMRNSELITIKELKEFWNRCTREEREVYLTVREEHITINAQKVLSDIIESAIDDGYEEMDICCIDGITEEQMAKLQSVLEDITSGPEWHVYIVDEKINPDVEVTEEMPKQADIKDN